MGVSNVSGPKVAVQSTPAVSAPVTAPADDLQGTTDSDRFDNDLRWQTVGPPTLGDLPASVQDAVKAQLKQLLPTSTPAYQQTLKVATSDWFARVPPGDAKAVLAGAAGQGGVQLAPVLASKGFQGLDPATQASVAASASNDNLSAQNRSDLVRFIDQPALSKLDPKVKNALVAAVAKDSDPKEGADLLKLAQSKGFQSLDPRAQVGLLQAVGQQSGPIELDGQDDRKSAVLALAKSPEFQNLDGDSQARWAQALSSHRPEVQKAAFERLADSHEVAGKAKLSSSEQTEMLHRRAMALGQPGSAPSLRDPLPGASTAAPTVTKEKGVTEKAVFMKIDAKGGIDPKPRKVDAYQVKIDGDPNPIEVIIPKPPPKGAPTIDEIATALAHQPAEIRQHIGQVIIQPEMKNYLQGVQEKDGRPNRVFMGPEAPHGAELTGYLSHEAGHLVHGDFWRGHPERKEAWDKTIESDRRVVSDYAATNDKEDAAETIQHYFQVKGTPAEEEMKRQIPAQYAEIRKMLGEN